MWKIGRDKKAAALVVTLAATALMTQVVQSGPAGAAEQSCASIPIFETDGYHASSTAATYQDYNAHVPTGYVARPVFYDGGVFPVIDKRALDNAVADGDALLSAAVVSFHAACPTTRIVITGYSEGAVVAGDVLQQFAHSTQIPHGLIQGVLYSDPRRQVGDGGRAGSAGGIETSIPSLLPGVTMQGGHDFGDVAVHSICHENDGICNSANFFTNTAAFLNGLVGYATGAHTYVKNPVGDLGNGTTLVSQPPVVSYGPSLPLPIPNPYQLQKLLGLTPSVFTSAVAAALATLPNGAALADQPWVRVLLGK